MGPSATAILVKPIGPEPLRMVLPKLHLCVPTYSIHVYLAFASILHTGPIDNAGHVGMWEFFNGFIEANAMTPVSSASWGVEGFFVLDHHLTFTLTGCEA